MTVNCTGTKLIGLLVSLMAVATLANADALRSIYNGMRCDNMGGLDRRQQMNSAFVSPTGPDIFTSRRMKLMGVKPLTHNTLHKQPTHYSCKTATSLFSSSATNEEHDTGPKNESTAKNEFSRTIRVNKWFGSVGTGASSSSSRGSPKVMNLSISATPSERNELATRFRLSKISALSAEVEVQPAFGAGGGINDGNECVEAKGTVSAKVTQKCVRTNEEFDVDLEFSFEAFLRAMVSTSISGGGKDSEQSLSAGESEALEAAARLDDGGRSRMKKGGNQKQQRGKAKGVRGGQSSNNLDAMGMKELSDILMEYEVTDEIIEDESCFCTDGIVDVGEIVAQMFRSKLDPYPKKPGTGPVTYSFTF